MSRQHKCGACGGNGVLFPCHPACRIPGLTRAWIVVEKCDSCDKFADDLSAALGSFEVAGWFLCADGGEHVLAHTQTQRATMKSPLPFGRTIL